METARLRDLDVHLLGPIAAERRGDAVALGGPRQRSVLARLALVAGQVVTVDRLIDDVWSGRPPATAVNTLQSYVSLLRRALGDPTLLRREGPGYLITLPREQMDAGRFEANVAAAGAALEADPATALSLLDAALAEWRGPALADVSDEPWARSAIVRWDDMRVAAIEWRADACLALGRLEGLVGELERALGEHPTREALAHRLMLALYRSGRQAEALRVYTRTRQYLAEEIGVDPGPDLVALQRAILNHDPELIVNPAAATPSTPAAPVVVTTAAPGPPSPPGPSPVPLPGPARRAGQQHFVGRRRHLDTLRRVWRDVQRGSRAVVLLSGETGIGKSRLAARFATEAHQHGTVVLWGRATPEAVVPFEPMVEALRNMLRTLSPEARRRIVTDRGLLTLLLPELTQLVPEVQPARAEPEIERYLLFETITDLLHTESTNAPILFVLDDLQWADSATLALLEHVLLHDFQGRVMALGTMRLPHDEPRPDVDRMLLRLERDGVLTKIRLRGLDAGEVEELLTLTDRADVDGDALMQATGGNAFYVTELLRHAGTLGEDDIPESVQAMIDVRLDRLDPAVNMVLNLVAVAGQAATLSVLAAAGDFEADRLLDAADLAVAAGLLVEDGAGRLAMPHMLTRQAVLARLSRTRRLDLHRRIGDALEHASEPHEVPETLAYHLLEAGSLADRSKRIAAGLDAGRRALDLATYDDAATWVRRVDELMTPQTPLHLQTELDLLRSDVQRALGDHRGALAAARTAAEHARAHGEPMLLARSAEAWMLSMSGVGFEIGEPPDHDLVAVMTEAIEALPAHERQYGVRLRSMLSSALVVSDDDWTRRERIADEAMAIAEVDGRAELRASALLARRLSWWRTTRLAERADVALAAVAEAGRTDNVHLELTTILVALADLLEQGRLEDHDALFERFQALSAPLRQPLYDVYTAFMQASTALSRGQYAVARRLADAALERGLASHGRNAVTIHATVWFQIHHDLGTLATTIDECERHAATGNRMWSVALAAAHALSGDLDAGRRGFERIIDVEGLHLYEPTAMLLINCRLVEVGAALGDRERTAAVAATLAPYDGCVASSGIGGVTIGPVARYLGLAALVAGDLDDAVDILQRAVDMASRDGMTPHEAAARHDLARALRQRRGLGDGARADTEAATAASLAATIGLHLQP